MSTAPRLTVPARQQAPKLILLADLEPVRCAARSGLADPADMLAVIDQVAIRDNVILTMSKRVAEVGTQDEQARAAAARELTDPNAPIHVHIEFDYVPKLRGGGAEVIEWLRDRTLEQLGRFVDDARVTATYRGESENWETATP